MHPLEAELRRRAYDMEARIGDASDFLAAVWAGKSTAYSHAADLVREHFDRDDE